MFVADSLYGASELPRWLDELVLTPEVQRLRGIRLINTSSPSLASLSDARRYTHTLGVARLALRAADASPPNVLVDRRTFVAAAICHDLATPPFGHLFEYLLKATTGWSHEAALSSLISGQYRPEGIYQQILPGQQLQLGDSLARLGVSASDVTDLVNGVGNAGTLIAGSIDFDNVDNVYRMAHLLGLGGLEHGDPTALAMALCGHSDLLPEGMKATDALLSWLDLRKRVYEVLVFDPATLSTQALLTDALLAGMDEGEIGIEHWYWTDEWLLYKLIQSHRTRQMAQRFIAGDLYSLLLLGWYEIPQGEVDLRHPEHRARLAKELSAATGLPCSPYVFYDNGTFSKKLPRHRLPFLDWDETEQEMGSTSRSTVVAVFTTRQEPPKAARLPALEVLSQFGLPSDALRPLPDKIGIYGLPGQRQLPL